VVATAVGVAMLSGAVVVVVEPDAGPLVFVRPALGDDPLEHAVTAAIRAIPSTSPARRTPGRMPRGR
jgi:hypothetical protein